MDELRWGLLIIGIAILAAIYWFARRKRTRWDDQDLYATPDGGLTSTLNSASMRSKIDPENLEQELAELQGVLVEDRGPATPATSSRIAQPPRLERQRLPRTQRTTPALTERTATAREQPRTPPAAEIVILHVVTPAGQSFHGPDILRAARASGLVFSDKHIFHRLSPDLGSHHPVFGLLNMVKPGSFDIKTLDALYTPGLALFMELPCTDDDLAAYQDMLGTAQTIAASLDGILCDERRNPLTTETIARTRERIRDIAHQQG